jgi:hypothetical protein
MRVPWLQQGSKPCCIFRYPVTGDFWGDRAILPRMKNNETVQQFIQLRAQGLSFARITDQLSPASKRSWPGAT